MIDDHQIEGRLPSWVQRELKDLRTQLTNSQEHNARLQGELFDYIRKVSRVSALCSGPGYRTVTVKQVLTAMSGDTED